MQGLEPVNVAACGLLGPPQAPYATDRPTDSRPGFQSPAWASPKAAIFCRLGYGLPKAPFLPPSSRSGQVPRDRGDKSQQGTKPPAWARAWPWAQCITGLKKEISIWAVLLAQWMPRATSPTGQPAKPARSMHTHGAAVLNFWPLGFFCASA